MDWVKRNLYFVIGSAVALALMGLAGFYLYSGWRHKNVVFEKLSAQYAELKRLYDLNPNPGSGKVDNIKAARDQQEQLREFIRRSGKYFAPPPAIPDTAGKGGVTSESFTSQLRRTVDQLRRDAENLSVTLPSDYYFSFEAQKTLMRFAAGSLDPMAVQLGEIKAICDVLFAAKINALDNLRRERVSNDDYKGPPSNYLEQKSVTNDLAILVPYEVTFRCFSAELAGVLNGLQSSPYCLLAKTVDVEPASATPGGDPNAPEGTLPPDYISTRYGVGPQVGRGEEMGAFRQRYGVNPEGVPANPYAQRYGVNPEAAPATPGTPRYPVGGVSPGAGMGMGASRRYGDTGGERYGGGGGGGQSLGGIPYRPLAGAQAGTAFGQSYAAPAYPAPASPYGHNQATAPAGTQPTRGGLQTVLDEQPLRVTLLIHVVKLLPKENRR